MSTATRRCLWVLRDVLGMTGTKFGCGDGAVRRLHRAYRRRRDALLRHADRQRRQVRDHDDRGDRRDARRAPGSRRPGSTSRSCSAATASRARSCPRRRCSPATRIRPTPTSTTRCPATSAAAEPMSASARRSSRPRNRSEQGACHDPRSHRFPLADPDQSAAASGPSRRRFLQAGAAAGGGLMLSLSLPFGRRRRRAADAADFRAQRLHPHRRATGRSFCVMPYVEMGQGTYTSIPMLIAEELEVDLNQVQPRACSAQPEALRQSLVRGRPGDRRLDLDPRGLEAAARGRAQSRGPCWSRRRRSAGMSIRPPATPGAARSFTRATAQRATYGELAADAALMPVPENVALKRAAGFQADRHPGEAPRHAGEGQRNGHLRHRRPAAGREDRDARPVAGLRRPGQERGRQGGQGGQGRAPDRDGSTTRSRSWPTIWARPRKGWRRS